MIHQMLTYKEAVEAALQSAGFREWRATTFKGDEFSDVGESWHSGPQPEPKFTEQHYTPAELAKTWRLSAQTIRTLFENEPGVLLLQNNPNGRKRGYRTFSIPESVALRVHRKLTNGRG